jgi:hypothetical protein
LQNGHTPAARAAITLSLVLLGEGSAAEQMRDSGKIITTARQDELDKLSEGINFAFPDSSPHFVNIGNSHAALCSPLVS